MRARRGDPEADAALDEALEAIGPTADMVGGGPFNLEPGQWTDDTSMALCLATSLIECRGFDQLGRHRLESGQDRDGEEGDTAPDIGDTERDTRIPRIAQEIDVLIDETPLPQDERYRADDRAEEH